MKQSTIYYLTTGALLIFFIMSIMGMIVGWNKDTNGQKITNFIFLGIYTLFLYINIQSLKQTLKFEKEALKEDEIEKIIKDAYNNKEKGGLQ